MCLLWLMLYYWNADCCKPLLNGIERFNHYFNEKRKYIFFFIFNRKLSKQTNGHERSNFTINNVNDAHVYFDLFTFDSILFHANWKFLKFYQFSGLAYWHRYLWGNSNVSCVTFFLRNMEPLTSRDYGLVHGSK